MAVIIRIGDLDVGQARSVDVEEARRHVRLAGLDSPANLFFSAFVGPGDPRTPVGGDVEIRDEQGRTLVTASGAQVFQYSSGDHEVVLEAATLRR